MQYVLLVYQGTNWARLPDLSEDDRKSLVAEYAAINNSPGATPGLPLGLHEKATTVRVDDGETLTTEVRSSTPREPLPVGTSLRPMTSTLRSRWPRAFRRRVAGPRSRYDQSKRIGSEHEPLLNGDEALGELIAEIETYLPAEAGSSRPCDLGHPRLLLGNNPRDAIGTRRDDVGASDSLIGSLKS